MRTKFPSSDPTQYVIKSESDAYNFLEECYNDDVNFNDIEIKFDGWPKLEIHVTGSHYNGTITPSLMKGFLSFQSSIYRSYASTKYGTININKLTQDEKEFLEIQVKVLAGSSKLGIDFQELLEDFMASLSEKLEPKHVIAIVLSIGVLYFGSSSYKDHLDQRKEIRLAEISSKEKKEVIETLHFSSEQETERAKILKDIVLSVPKVNNIVAYSEQAKNDLVKTFKKVDTVNLQGISLTGEEAGELVKNARRKPHEVRLDGEYRIMVVDSTDKQGFKVKILNTSTHDEFYAVVQDRTLNKKHLAVIQEAEWSKKPVKLSINATQFGDEIRKASIIKAIAIPQQPKI